MYDAREAAPVATTLRAPAGVVASELVARALAIDPALPLAAGGGALAKEMIRVNHYGPTRRRMWCGAVWRRWGPRWPSRGWVWMWRGRCGPWTPGGGSGFPSPPPPLPVPSLKGRCPFHPAGAAAPDPAIGPRASSSNAGRAGNAWTGAAMCRRQRVGGPPCHAPCMTTDTPMPASLPDGRPIPLMTGDERPMLESWLAFHRATLELKCAGLGDPELRLASAEPSGLTLLGLVQHLAECERNWFQRVAGGLDVPPVYGAGNESGYGLDGARGIGEALHVWRREIARGREVCAGRALDRVVGSWTGQWPGSRSAFGGCSFT